MPFEIKYEHGGTGVLVTATGEVRLAEVRQTFDKVWKRPESKFLRYHIVHVTRESRFDASFDGIRDLGMMIPETLMHNPQVRNAVVAEGAVMMGIVRTALLIARVWAREARVEAFSDLAEARRWVDSEFPDLVGQAV